MIKQKVLAAAASSSAIDSFALPQGSENPARLGLRIDRHTTPSGPFELKDASEPRLFVHDGGPTRGLYRSQAVLYTRGDIDIFPAGHSDAWEADDGSTALVLQLSPLLLYRAAEGMGRDPDRATIELRCQIRDLQIEHTAWALDAEHRAGYPSGLLYTESLGLALAVRLLGGSTVATWLPRGLSKQQLRHLTTYIEEHLDQNLSLLMLASVAGVSVSHLKILFKRSTGLPVHEYVIQRRVERAKMLLLRGELPASQVALEVGFSHQSHMARWMRRILGVTPTSLVDGSRR